MKIVDRKFLPTVTNSVHASTIEFWDNHTIFSWFGGSREGAGDSSIYIYNLHNENEITSIGTKDSIPRWNPILYNDNGSLYLFGKRGEFCDRWQTFYHNLSNFDKGRLEKETIAHANFLPAGLNGPTKTKPIKYWDGDREKVLCGSSCETFYDWSSSIECYDIQNGIWNLYWRSNPLYLKNKKHYTDKFNGSTQLTKGIIQPAIWCQGNKGKEEDFVTINMLMRSSSGLDYIYYAQVGYQDRECVITNPPRKTNIPNPNSGIDVVCKDGFIYLVCNPSNIHRYPLVIYKINGIKPIYKDASATTIEEELIYLNIVDEIIITPEIDMSLNVFTPELSYPYMIEKDGKLHLTYTYGRRFIEYVTIEI